MSSTSTLRFAAGQWVRAGLGVLVIAMGGVGGPPDLQRFFFLGLAALFAMVYALPCAGRFA